MPSGLYVHIPYCHSKCYYCDFYSMPDSSTAPVLLDALISEARLRRDELSEPVTTVYIGGGTPSSLGHEALASLIGRLRQELDLSHVGEFTVELNPEDVAPDMLDTLRSVGVNRGSMGIQSLVDDELKLVGRRHSSVQALEAARLIAEKFDNYSFDLIFGLPEQTMDSLEYSLNNLIALNAPHLSAYLLSYEQGTRLYAMMMAGKVEEASEETCEEMFHYVDKRLTEAGYRHYEISNFAKPGCESVHNSNYWNTTPYLGLGPGAHSFDGNMRRHNPRSIKEYLGALTVGKNSYVDEPESMENKFNDYVITRLRTEEGIDLRDLASRPFGEFASTMTDTVNRLAATGHLIVTGTHIFIPRHYWLTADAILRDLII